MKKLMLLALVLILALTLNACINEKTEPTVVYSFYGQCDDYVISNGTIVLSGSENIFYGGNLQAAKPENFKNISSYTATFYIEVGDKQEIVFVDKLLNNSSVKLLNSDLGKTISDDSGMYELFSELYNSNGSFWCDLKTTDIDGNSYSDSIALELTKITE